MKDFEQGAHEAPAKKVNASEEVEASAKDGGKVNFYRLDKSKPYAAEGAASKYNFNIITILGVLFTVGGIVAAIISRGQF